MKILFIGNSIIQGVLGESFVKLFARENPNWIIKNSGIGGDTLTNVSERVITELSHDAGIDFIVFESGYNDIILPYFNKRGFLFRLALKFLLFRGRNPLSDPIAFKAEYKKIVGKMKEITSAKIVLMTLGCINENLQFELNIKRLEFNQIIREIAEEKGCLLADVGQQFEFVLSQRNQTNYILKSFWNSVYFDRKACNTTNGAKKLSSKRSLQLTIDGVHLNSDGAEIFKSVIQTQINTI
ncbi:GDSL-type esterase/lipase family protein [Pedobacter foliorum]|uniref:SGNH/GDSL hydrolase family protein n=1 Tax=Pedobacter foliorum TaxID=2739058 RepID=UPI001563E793|nr:GDSL-type esterase/lipase family protein [Pedobacter foliorum]NRF40240.1 hypothetical protein [Pedobacter foliorum]